MRTSTKGLIEIAAHEGLVTAPYKDSVGVWTIGVGHTEGAGLPNPAKMQKGSQRPPSEMLDLFRRDIKKYEAGVNRVLGRKAVRQHEYDAMVSFHYNTGAIGRAAWVKKLLAGDKAGAVVSIMAWKKPPEIIGRRKKEQKLLNKAVYTANGYTNVYPASRTGKVLWSRGKKMNLLQSFPEAAPTPVPPIPVGPPHTPHKPEQQISFWSWLISFFKGRS